MRTFRHLAPFCLGLLFAPGLLSGCGKDTPIDEVDGSEGSDGLGDHFAVDPKSDTRLVGKSTTTNQEIDVGALDDEFLRSHGPDRTIAIMRGVHITRSEITIDMHLIGQRASNRPSPKGFAGHLPAFEAGSLEGIDHYVFVFSRTKAAPEKTYQREETSAQDPESDRGNSSMECNWFHSGEWLFEGRGKERGRVG
jgi:hypothetical protein